jgi:chromosome segregation ATPase
MSNQKLTEEELKTIKEIQEQNQALALELGNLELTKIQVENRYDELVEFYNQLKEKEQELGKQLSDKYGNGTINLELGEFVPTAQ